LARVRTSREARLRRHRRVRVKVSGSSERPRLAVFRSLEQIYAQVIDDVQGHTLVAASSLEPNVRSADGKATKTTLANQVGKLLAQRAKDKGISQVVFDRGGYLYHGRVKALAEGARDQGLQF
jgi:large subunit ribosomal protein L18